MPTQIYRTQQAQPQTTEKEAVACQVCGGLACLCRPRFYAGQLLTADDLNRLDHYILQKNRLHNRYLHGWGVVCGLQVACHECEGWVTVQEGYAIDPCGNDIIVAQDHHLNFTERIQACRQAGRRPDDCEPKRPRPGEACPEDEEHWCLALAYVEREAKPITALRHQPAQACGCGAGNGCGCSDWPAGSKTQVARSSTRSAVNGTNAAHCQPSLICEEYRLDLFRVPPDYCRDLEAKLENSLLARVAECVATIRTFLGRRVPSKGLATLYPIFFVRSPRVESFPTNATPPDQYDAYCRLYEAIRALYIENPLGVRCALRDALNKIDCPPPRDADDVALYGERLRPSLNSLVSLLLQYLIDCLCQTLLPPCPPNTHDDRLVLACVTVREDKIVHICNFSCRPFAGTFPSISYWLSALPIIPILTQAVTRLCCDLNLFDPQPGKQDNFSKLLRTVDPTWAIRETTFEEDFALPKLAADRLATVIEKFSFAGLAELLPPNRVNLATFQNKPADEVGDTLAKAGVTPIWRDVASADEIPLYDAIASGPFAVRGENVILFRTPDKRVVGFKPYDPREALRDSQAEMESLRKELSAMKTRLSKLEKGKK